MPAAFSGVQLFENIPNNSRLDIRIEWWDSARRLGAVAHSVTSYQHYSGKVGPYSPLAYCSKW